MYNGLHYINGHFCGTQSTEKLHNLNFAKVNPATEEAEGHFPLGIDLDVNAAVAAAKKAFQSWRNVSRIKRAEYFNSLCSAVTRNFNKLVNVISIETGKTNNEATAEVNEALHMAQYTFGMGRMPTGQMLASEIADKDSYIIRKPKGVVGVISPWNFPLAIGGFWCAAPAILEGNTVVFKPSEETPMTGQLTAELYHEAGFPPGVFNMVHGTGDTGEVLVRHEDVKHICFTGSKEVGTFIRRACCDFPDKTCSCEMGSKSAVMIFEDADVNMAVQAALTSAFKLSGQRCVSSGRILVQRSFMSTFREKFLDAVQGVLPTDSTGMDYLYATVTIGPLINRSQYERVMTYNQLVRNDSHAKVLFERQVLKKPGYYLLPFVYECEWADKPYLKQEVFGPHVALVPFNDVEDAIRIYNDTDYGLSLGLITNDMRIARKVRDRCDFGMGYWNGGSIAAESHLPFSGVKASGYGGASAAGTFDTVVNKVTWTVNHGPLSFPQGMK